MKGGEGPLFLLRAAESCTGLEDVCPSPGGERPSGIRPQNGVCLGLPAEEGPQGFSRAGRESGLSWGSASMARAKQGPKQQRSTSALWMGLVHPQAPGWWPQSCPGAASLPRVPREQGQSLVATGPRAYWDRVNCLARAPQTPGPVRSQAPYATPGVSPGQGPQGVPSRWKAHRHSPQCRAGGPEGTPFTPSLCPPLPFCPKNLGVAGQRKGQRSGNAEVVPQVQSVTEHGTQTLPSGTSPPQGSLSPWPRHSSPHPCRQRPQGEFSRQQEKPMSWPSPTGGLKFPFSQV